MSPRRFRVAASLAGVVALALGATQSASALTPTITEHAVPTASSKPIGLAAGPDGALWFAESAGNRIGRVTASGVFTEFPLPNPSSDPQGIVAGADGSLWFAEGTGGDRIGSITPAGVITEHSIPTANSGALSIAAGPDGNLWFTEMSAGKVGRITPAGVITEFPLSSSSSQPEGMVAAGGALWLVEHAADVVARISTSGAITEYPIPTATSGPTDVALGSDGNVWFTETSTGKIGRITLAGAITEFALPSAGAGPFGLTSGPDGALWFTETTSDAIGRITTAGSVTEFPLSRAAAAPEDIEPGPDGNVWFTEFSGNQVGQITTPPAAITGGASAVQFDGATLAGVANARTQTTSSHFEYGSTPAYGATTAAQGLAPTGANQGFSSVLSGLAAGSTYHYRLVVQNATGMTVGADQTFATLPAPPASPPGAPAPAVSPTPLSRNVPILSPTLLSVTANTPPAVTISGAAITVTRGRVAPVLVKCPVTALSGCHGTVSIALAKGPASASGSRTRAVAARCARGCRPLGESKLSASRGQSKRVPVKLSRYAFHLLALHGKLSVRVTVATVISGHTLSQSRVVIMRAPRRA